jgi:hypothetical protein
VLWNLDDRQIQIDMFMHINVDTVRGIELAISYAIHEYLVHCANHHHQPIYLPTAGAQAFHMDYPQGERAITHNAGPVPVGGC